MEQDEGFGLWIWRVAEVIEVAVGAEATNDVGTGWGIDREPSVGDGDFAIVADADAGLLAPDVGPPRTLGDGAEDGALLGEGFGMGGLRGPAEFAVDFMLVGVGDELSEQLVGTGEFGEVFGGQERDQAFLPVVVAAFDFAFGLGRKAV